MTDRLQLNDNPNQGSIQPDSAFRSKPHSLSRNAFWNIGATAVSMALLFFLAPFLIRHIGVENYGVYLFLGTISGMLGLANLGLGEATLRYVAHYAAQSDLTGINRVFRSTFFVTTVSGSIVALAAAIMAPWIISSLKFSHIDTRLGVYLFQLTAISFWIRFISSTFFSIPQALLRYDVYSKILIGESLLRALGSIMVVIMGWGLEGLILLNLLLSIIFAFASIVSAKCLIAGLRFWQFPSRKGIREVFSYGIYAFASQLVGMGWQYADRILLAVFVSAAAIAYFSVPQDLVMRVLTLVAGAPTAVLMPRFAGIMQKEHLTKLYIQATSIFLCLTIVAFVPAAVFIKDFLRLWISPEFAQQSGMIAFLFCASSLIRGAFLPYEALFRGIGRPQYYLVLITLSSLTVIITGLILIPKLGLMGAGYAICLTPLWGVGAIAFSLYYILRVPSIFLAVKLFVVPSLIGFTCMGVGLWVKKLYGVEVGWFGMIIGVLISFVSTVMMLVIYELTICKKEEGFKVARNLVKIFQKKNFSHANNS